ncbi:MAG: tRNA (N6-threonylcarbamoyladenosine(37)-N6)-methyltransferase TrmO [Halarsenatibacteraceae bacterium]
MKEITFKPIGRIRSQFKKPEGTPIQPPGAEGIEGKIELLPEFEEGLKDLERFSHLILLYHCHLAGACSLRNKPFMEDKEHGVFAIRAPSRPNSIGLSVVRLDKIAGNILYIKDVDIVDGTPLLDIKPYVPEFDSRENVRIGWLEENVGKMHDKKDDGRFI